MEAFFVFPMVMATVAAFVYAMTWIGRSGPKNDVNELKAQIAALEAQLRHAPARHYDAAALEKRSKSLSFYWNLGAMGLGFGLFGIMTQAAHLPVFGIGLGVLVWGVLSWVGTLINSPAPKNVIMPSLSNAAPQPVLLEAPKVAAEGLPQGRAELLDHVLSEATKSLKALDERGGQILGADGRASVAQIVATGQRVMAKVAADPTQFNEAQRLFTYYAPEAIKVVTGLAEAEQSRQPDQNRILATQTLLKKLATLFDKIELDLAKEDARALDLDVRLLDQALDADLKTLA